MKILKYLALTVGVLIAAGLIVNAILVWQTGKRLEERLSRLRAAGEPLSLPELGALPVPPGADAAAVLTRIEPEIKALFKEMAPVLNEISGTRPMTDDGWKKIETAIANHPTVLPALAEAAACPSYKSPLNYYVTPSPSFVEELSTCVLVQREVANVLKYRAELQLRAKDRDGALRTCLTALRISRHTGQEPLMISYLVVIATRSIAMGVVNEILQAGPVAADLHKELDAELAKVDSSDGYRWSLRSERSYGLLKFEELNVGGWFTRAYNNDEKCYYLDQTIDWLNHADDSYAKFQAESAATGTVTPGVRHTLTHLLVPATLKVHEADFRVRCLGRSLRVLNALTAKNLKEVPANLTDLGLPAAATTDPYTDKPLIVKRVDGQWLVYGLGPNLKDDGGLLDKFEDVGYGPVKPEK
jgi:hypothetical protein